VSFEWDNRKNAANIRKHGFSFERAKAIFNGEQLTFRDKRKAYGEDRFISIGIMGSITVIAVVHTDRKGNTRIISARPANRKERKQYEAYKRTFSH
jgi:uncharacterized DUF497 family protein